jgi:small subunit ribosomal protein S25
MHNEGDSKRLIYFSENGKTTTLDLDNKWSTTILKELMTIAGGDPWKKHVAASTAAGLPPVIGEAFQREVVESEVERKVKKNTEPLPSLKEYRAKNPPAEKPDVDKSKSSTPPGVSTPSTSSSSAKSGNRP